MPALHETCVRCRQSFYPQGEEPLYVCQQCNEPCRRCGALITKNNYAHKRRICRQCWNKQKENARRPTRKWTRQLKQMVKAEENEKAKTLVTKYVEHLWHQDNPTTPVFAVGYTGICKTCKKEFTDEVAFYVVRCPECARIRRKWYYEGYKDKIKEFGGKRCKKCNRIKPLTEEFYMNGQLPWCNWCIKKTGTENDQTFQQIKAAAKAYKRKRKRQFARSGAWDRRVRGLLQGGQGDPQDSEAIPAVS